MIRLTTYIPAVCGSGCRKTTISPRRGSRYGNSGPTQEVSGANWTRFTKTWSPISSVFSIELEGISNACTTNVMMNRPVTSTAASEERNSTVVSFGFSFSTLFSGLSSFFATLNVPVPNGIFSAQISRPETARRWEYSVYQPESAVPARDLKDVSDGVRHVIQPARDRSRGVPVPVLHRPVNDQRSSNNVFLRHESPIAAVQAVVAVVAHHEVVSFRNNELAVHHQLLHLQPPLPLEPSRGDVHSGKVIAIQVVEGLDESHVGLVESLAVDQDSFVHHPKVVSRHADHALHEVLLRVHRIMKHDDIPAVDLLVRHQMVAPYASPIAELVHQQIIPDEQRVLHRFRRNLERLHNESDHEDRNHHRPHQRLQRTDHVGAESSVGSAVG